MHFVDFFSQNSTKGDGVDVVLWELLTADIQCIESIRAIGTMLQQVLFRLRLLLHRLVLMEAVASAFDTGRLDGQDQVIVVLAVEERHEALLAREALIDEKVIGLPRYTSCTCHPWRSNSWTMT